ncbi:hypothetical protein [Streptomyces pratensis]|uniref:hypothetical protein n=1 Tax=Streptomyces pratensis TaxID=1169025 RepID=UPI003016F5DA
MLQCTAYTALPMMGARVALMALESGPDPTSGACAPDDFLLCELGEHDGDTEHAAQLWSAGKPATRDLWMFWTDADTDIDTDTGPHAVPGLGAGPDPDPGFGVGPDPGPGPGGAPSAAAAAGARRKFRFAELLPCPAVIHRLSVREGEACVLYDRHPAAHSWEVRDPLADLMAERIRQEVRRDRDMPDGP